MINNIHVYPGVGEYIPVCIIVILIFNEYNWNINIKSGDQLKWDCEWVFLSNFKNSKLIYRP